MANTGNLAVLILAAGEGTRMRSNRPKVLHPVCGRPILLHQARALQQLGAKRIVVVVGTGSDEVRRACSEEPVEFVTQSDRLGTAHAALQARALLENHDGPLLIMNGDHPLFRPETFETLASDFAERSTGIQLLVGEYPDPAHYGRIVRNSSGAIEGIVEFVDADTETREIHEINLGVYLADAAFCFELLDQVDNQNAKGEYFLTDIVSLALRRGARVETTTVRDWTESLGINSREDLALAEAVMRRRIARHWMEAGVTFEDPERTYVGADVELSPDTTLAAGVSLRGRTRIGPECLIAEGAVIEDSELGERVTIKPHCCIEGSLIGDGCTLGPSAHLRPGSQLDEDVRVGNFVEIKNSKLGRGTKADHLSYLGDADIGAGVTIGCGAITVNYDGREKRRTVICDGAFVGCNSNLIAPVTIESNAYVAAGSTITTKVPAEALGVARARQRNVDQWRRRRFGIDEDA